MFVVLWNLGFRREQKRVCTTDGFGFHSVKPVENLGLSQGQPDQNVCLHAFISPDSAERASLLFLNRSRREWLCFLFTAAKLEKRGNDDHHKDVIWGVGLSGQASTHRNLRSPQWNLAERCVPISKTSATLFMTNFQSILLSRTTAIHQSTEWHLSITRLFSLVCTTCYWTLSCPQDGLTTTVRTKTITNSSA